MDKRKKKRKEKPKIKRGGKSNRGEKEKTREKREKRKKGGEKKMEIFPAFRQSNLDCPRVKVDPRNEGYVWIPKSGSFDKL